MRRFGCISLVGLLLLVWMSACSGFTRRGKWGYPIAPKGDVVDSYHGIRVADPYRWLEDPDAESTRSWVAAQNAITRYFVQTPSRQKMLQRLGALYDYPKVTLPRERNGILFFERNDGLENQARLMAQTGTAGEARVILDPNAWSKDGTVALMSWWPSRDGTRLAYARSSAGSDWQEIRVRDLASGKDMQDVLRHCRSSSVAWHPDGTGFWYDRFPDPASVEAADRNTNNKVYWHELSSPQSADQLVYERPDDKMLSFSLEVSQDGAYLLLHVYRGTDPKNRIYFRKLSTRKAFVRLLDEGDASYSFIENIGTSFYFQTDQGAPRGRVVVIDVDKPGRPNWREVVAEGPDVLEYSVMVNNRLVLTRMRDVHSVMEIVDLNGERVAQVPLPGIGSASWASGLREATSFYYAYSSFTVPSEIHRYDFESDRSSLFHRPSLKFDPDAFVTRQVFYKSKDGTRVPMFITHLKGLAMDGKAPALLYGYGGFNISLTPYFSFARLMWMEQGGVYAVANLRGGLEYGEAWHQAGVLGKKQNVFDDFIAAAETLLREKITSKERLAILGRSNGGLLTAACMLQRPDLFGAVLSAVPVIDMLRYHRFTVGKYWVSDYGDAEKSKEHFEFLMDYSPLHNVKQGQVYPATLLTTADTDDRVVPAHAKKFAAALQAADGGQNPILLRVETKAGHGLGKPTGKRIAEKADMYSFLFRVFGLEFE
jgi:prolyl oligopeptidase